MTPETRISWLKSRQAVLTATDIRRLIYPYFFDDRPQAAVIYDEKVAESVIDNPGSPLMQMGSFTEPFNAAIFEQKTGFTLGIPEPLSIHPEYSWMGASIDREITNATQGYEQDCELKYTGPFFGPEWGPDDTDIFPAGYHAQTQWQMACRGRKFGRLQALNGTGETRRYQFRADESMINPLMEIGYDYWHDFVVPRRRPPEDWIHPRAMAIAEGIFEAKTGTRTIITDPMAQIHCHEYEQYSEIESEAAKKAAQAKSILIHQYMKENEVAVCGPFLLSRIPRSRFLKKNREPRDASKPRPKSRKVEFFE